MLTVCGIYGRNFRIRRRYRMKAVRWFFMNYIGTTLTAGRTTAYGGLWHVYCGRVDREQPPEWFQKLEQEDFRCRWTDGDSIYFYIDSPTKIDYSEKYL